MKHIECSDTIEIQCIQCSLSSLNCYICTCISAGSYCLGDFIAGGVYYMYIVAPLLVLGIRMVRSHVWPLNTCFRCFHPFHRA